MEESVRVLKPGGIAIHTTEFNYTKEDETIDNWPTVLFRKKDFMELAERLELKGYSLPPISFNVGSTPIDWFIDVPPYPYNSEYYDQNLHPPHLKVTIDGFPATCFGITVQK